jgi:Sulfatase
MALAAVAGCNGGDPGRSDPPRPAPTSSAAARPPPEPQARVLLDMIQALPGCDVDHRGPLLDAGSPAMAGRFGWSDAAPPGLTSVEHDGSTWARFVDRKFTLSFALTETTQIFVAARGVGYGAKSISVALDDQPLGTLSLGRELIRVAQTGTTTLPVDPGLHTLTFRFFGHVRDGDAFADLDWIRVGVPDDSPSTYGPPTLRDLVVPAAALGSVPHRALGLRAPGVVRCALRLPEAAELRTAVGVQGDGEGDAEIRILADGKKPEVLKTIHLQGGDKAVWTPLTLPLAAHARELVALELRATSAPRGGRVLFGDPVVALTAPPPPPTPLARAVVVVVLDGVERGDLPPWSAARSPTLAALTDLAESGAVFDQHRAPSTVVASAVASLLTGLPPSAHGLSDAAARLPASQTTIAGVARDAAVRTAMFTGVPHTFRAYGFATSWERFVEMPPSSGDPATAPIDAAAAFITEVAKSSADARLLAFVHTRGGHGPWDVTNKELSTAAPTDYSGLLDPRKGAQLVGRMRRSKHVATIVSEADRLRLRSLTQIGLAGQDRAIGALVAALKTANLWDSTLLVVTSDNGVGVSDLFSDGGELKDSLKEPALTLPLYVHFPGGVFAGKRVSDPTEAMDIPRSALSALGLSFSRPSPGRDLSRVASGFDEPATGPQIAAIDNRYSARWGSLVLSGKYPNPPQLCDLSIDPTCAFNRREAMPIAVGAIFRSMVAAESGARVPASKREPATIDQETAAALSVWGASE